MGNLIAFKPGTLPSAAPIFFSSHFDTVEPTSGLEIAVQGDLIRATSDTILGGDDNCGVAPILEAMRLLHEFGEAHGDIQPLLMICEEIGLVGAKMLITPWLLTKPKAEPDDNRAPGDLAGRGSGEQCEGGKSGGGE